MKLYRTRIAGLGHYVPEKVLTNADLEKMVETTDEWIQTRTGISERRIASPTEAASDLSYRAALMALEDAKIPASELDLIMVATVSGDMVFPSTACIVQNKLGAKCPAFDISAACSGYPYALAMAEQLIAAGGYKNILVIGVEVMSRFIDWTDRSTCILFGDGAGASVVTRSTDSAGILAVDLGADGAYAELLKIPAGGSRMPASQEALDNRLFTVKMDGAEIFKLAVRSMGQTANNAIAKAGLVTDDISLFIPHQANMRIITSLAKHLKLPMERVFVNVHKYGNMSAASTIVAFSEAVKTGRVKKGDKVLLVAFGAGLTWGSIIIQW